MIKTKHLGAEINMSYDEYFDLYKQAQQKDCPYRAFMFDVANCKTNPKYREKYFDVIKLFLQKIKQQEILTDTKILRYNSNNMPIFESAGDDGRKFNPMILGDMFTVFVENGSISTQKLLALFAETCKQLDYNYKFHFATCMYESDSYIQGGTKLYKGYVPQILEKISKTNNFYIDKNYTDKGEEKI